MYNKKISDNNKTKNYKKVEEFEMNRINVIDLDEEIVDVKRWTELKNVRSYYEFFKKHEDEF